MSENRYNRFVSLFCMLLLSITAYAQYSVTGGASTPLLASDDTGNRIKVYMVYGMDNVEIRYSSTSSSHEWFRYKTDALSSSEPLQSTQEGTSSLISNIQEGYGYYVKESENIGMNNFIWIIDYSKYVFDIQNFRVLESDYQCEAISFDGTVNMPLLSYYPPSSSVGRKDLERQLELHYTTMIERPAEQRFVLLDTVETITGDPFASYYATPYADTEFTITGDQFARHFNVEKSASTDQYQAVAVVVVGDTTHLSMDGTNVIQGNEEGSLSAPIDIRFFGYGNTPTAIRLEWVISRKDETTSELTFLRRELEELTYPFTQSGTYIAQLFAYGPSGDFQCMDSTSFEIKIRESDLRIPNTFSPGTSPGINDEFKVAYKSLISFKGWIFNRWGAQLFYWSDPAKGWDGRRNGKLVPPGVYFYVIEAKGSDGIKYNKKGHINIIRPKNEQGEISE